MATAKRKVSYEARTAMLNARNREARKRKWSVTGPKAWCSPWTGVSHNGNEPKCPRCGPRPTYVGTR